MKKIFSSLILLSLVILPSYFLTTSVQAQGIKGASGPLNSVAGKSGLQENSDLSTIVGTIINAALSLVGIIFLALTVYAGILWMTARGEEDQITKSKNILRASLIGMFITVSAYAITYFVTSKFE